MGDVILLANLYIHVNNNCFNIFLRIHIIIIPDHSSKVRISRIETNGYDSETAKTGQLNLVFCSLPKANGSSRFDKKVYQVIKKYISINYRMSNATISRFNLVLTERWRHKSFFFKFRIKFFVHIDANTGVSEPPNIMIHRVHSHCKTIILNYLIYSIDTYCTLQFM